MELDISYMQGTTNHWLHEINTTIMAELYFKPEIQPVSTKCMSDTEKQALVDAGGISITSTMKGHGKIRSFFILSCVSKRIKTSGC